jgi:hypothetical protein
MFKFWRSCDRLEIKKGTNFKRDITCPHPSPLPKWEKGLGAEGNQIEKGE